MPTPSPRMSADAPIGIFDSGFGGLTVARSVIDQLPHESVVYLGDTARQPLAAAGVGTLILGCTHYPLLGTELLSATQFAGGPR